MAWQEQGPGHDLGLLTLMGARLYNPVTGRFLSVDPVPGGTDIVGVVYLVVRSRPPKDRTAPVANR